MHRGGKNVPSFGIQMWAASGGLLRLHPARCWAASLVAIEDGGTGYTGRGVGVEELVESKGSDSSSGNPDKGPPISPAASERAEAVFVMQSSLVGRGKRGLHNMSTQRRASKSRYVLPAVLISALAAAGMMGYVTPKKTPASQKADVETVAARAGAEQFDSDATEKKSAEIAQETEESRRRRKQAALVAAVLVAAAVYGLRSSLLGVDKVSSPTALQGLLKKPESMHGIDPDASVDFQPDASVERQMEVPAEGAGDEVRGWQHLVQDFSAMSAGEYALSPRVGAVASAVALGLLAFSLAAARRASRRRQQQGEERPASPTAGEEQADPVSAEAVAPAAEPEEIPKAEPEKPEEEEVPAAAADPTAQPEEIPKAEPEKPEEEEVPAAGAAPAAELEQIPKAEPEKPEEEVPPVAADPTAEPEEIPKAEPEKSEEEEVPPVAADPTAEPEEIPKAEPEKPEEEEVPAAAGAPEEPEDLPEAGEEGGPADSATAGVPGEVSEEPEKVEQPGGVVPDEPVEETRTEAQEIGTGSQEIGTGSQETEIGAQKGEEPREEKGPERTVGDEWERGMVSPETESMWEDSEDEGEGELDIHELKSAVWNLMRKYDQKTVKFRTRVATLTTTIDNIEARLYRIRELGQPSAEQSLVNAAERLSEELIGLHEGVVEISTLQRLNLAVVNCKERVTIAQEEGMTPREHAAFRDHLNIAMSYLDSMRGETSATQGTPGGTTDIRAETEHRPSQEALDLKDINFLRRQLKQIRKQCAAAMASPKTGPSTTAQESANTAVAYARRIRSALQKISEDIKVRETVERQLEELEIGLNAAENFFYGHMMVGNEVDFFEEDGSEAGVELDSVMDEELKEEIQRRRRRLIRTVREREAFMTTQLLVRKYVDMLFEDKALLERALEEVENVVQEELRVPPVGETQTQHHVS
uniref:CARD domain-containing protein n=1 Tax=Neospora caninum (strain Liverpool) TaxID=572307 RepID=A0A0F7U9R6_NEOCL|nr:TPA: hypothetical protein BN1204_012200 [Neospora caninum Liverpool]